MTHDIAVTDLTQAELQIRLRQQAAVAALGQRALATAQLDALLDDAVTLVADALDVEYCAILERSSDDSVLVLRKCNRPELTVASDGTVLAQICQTVRTSAPMIATDLPGESRPEAPRPLSEPGATSGISVDIELRDGTFSVLCAYTRSRRTFGAHDTRFLEAMANVLAQAIERQRTEQELRQAYADLKHRVEERAQEPVQANTLLKQEIAERTPAEQELHASEACFRAIFEKVSVGIGLIDRQGRIADANPALQRILGYSAEELRGVPITRLCTSGDRFPCLDAFRSPRPEAEDTPCQVEQRCARKDGGEAYLGVTVSFVRGTDRQAGFAIAMVEDITRRKETEAQMRKLSYALEQTADFVIITDDKGVIEYVNPAFEEKTGYRRDEALGQTPRIIKSGVHGRDFYERLWKTISRGEAFRGVVVNRTRNGELYYEEKTITPLKDAQGRVTHFISTGKDITERRRAEQELRRHQAELAHVARLSTMGEMAAGLAHELNQPLSAIVNYSQGCIRRLRAGKAGADEMLPVVEQVRAQAERAGKIIRRMRNFARKSEPCRVAMDVNAMIREVAELAEPDVRRHQARLRLELADRAPPVLADVIQIEQVLLNLMLNGLEAMEAIHADDRELVVRTEAASPDTVKVTVRDSGPGLPAQVGKRIFDPFFTTKPKGMGMGLSLSRSIVEAHGGHLWVVSEVSRGATFQFTLPVAGKKDETTAHRSQ